MLNLRTVLIKAKKGGGTVLITAKNRGQASSSGLAGCQLWPGAVYSWLYGPLRASRSDIWRLSQPAQGLEDGGGGGLAAKLR